VLKCRTLRNWYSAEAPPAGVKQIDAQLQHSEVALWNVPCICGYEKPAKKLSRMEHNKGGSEPLSTQIIAPPGSSMWIVPPLVVCSPADLSRVLLASSPGVATDTGSRAQGSNSSPRAKARNHLNIWLAFTPCARAWLQRQLHNLTLL
jgi:hypothetical protein